LRVPALGQAKKVAMLGPLDYVTRQLIVHTSPTKRSSDFIAHLEQLDRLFGPQPGRQAKPVVLVDDHGPIHTSKRSLAASGVTRSGRRPAGPPVLTANRSTPGHSTSQLRFQPSSVYRIRHGDYRILYSVRPVIIVILDIDHRKDVYR
jgi:hypothetical protein